MDPAQIRDHLNRLVSQDAFASRAELNAYIASLGLPQVRNGIDHVTVIAGATRVRVYLSAALLRSPGELTRREQRRDGALGLAPRSARSVRETYSVYLIAAVDPQGEVAGYVGSTAAIRYTE